MIKYLYSKIKTQFDIPKLQSHRGFWFGDEALQNSLLSIKKAYDHRYQMCEFDVRLTADKKVVLFHDESIKDNQSVDQLIHLLSFEQLNQIRATDLLEDVFIWYKSIIDKNERKFNLNIEIKSKYVLSRDLEKEVIRLIEKYDLETFVIISSFNPMSLYYLKKKKPEIFRALLLTFNNEFKNNFVIKSQILNLFAKPHFLHLDEKHWRLKKYKKLMKMKIPIVLWTCNDLLRVKTYFDQGVTSVITDQIKPEDL